TNSKNVYSFIDNSAGIGTIFYRVRNIDIDGQSKYSSILRLQGINSYGNVLRMYPIPARTEATIEHKQLAQNAKITITTTDGRVVRTITPSAGASHTPVDLSGIAAGSYILRLDDGKGKIETLKFVKQ
ncbi:MAG: T9SS type A sorting domain-containing protein, partial [Flavisolibacter sp.]|nr:T9SS type A sorting domain-containing protein [Flavisolibacter sp.]